MKKSFLSKVFEKIAVIEEEVKYDPEQFEMGMKIEKEHSDSIKRILEDAKQEKIKSLDEYIKKIVMDHLNENENYYIDSEGNNRLKKMEEEAKKELEIKNPNIVEK